MYNPHWHQFRAGLRVAGLLCLGTSLAWAQPLDDPMRPSTSIPPQVPVEPAKPEAPPQPEAFRPANYPVSEIYLLGARSRVKIRGQWYEPGDRLADAVITDILPDAAVVMHDGLMHMLYRNNRGARFRRHEDSP